MKFHPKYIPFFELLEGSPKYRKIRYVVLTGGRGSGKSYALAAGLNGVTFNDGYGVLFTRFTMTSAHTSIIPEFRAMCESMGNDGSFEFKNTEVVNIESGCTISYRGLKPASNTANSALKSISGKNIMVVEEAEEIADQSLFEKVDLSIRTKEHQNIIILVLNPCHINHFIYKEFVDCERDDVMKIHTSYLDNYDNLDESFIRLAERQKERNIKKYNHLFMGHWMMDTDGALFRMADIERNRITIDQYRKKNIKEIVVSWDPAVTDKKKNQAGREPDADGIVCMARCEDNYHYLIGDDTMTGKRSSVANRVVRTYDQNEANWVVIEKNQGGDWLKEAILGIDRTVRKKMVTAVQSKAKRATASQSLMEQDIIRHVGHFPELEYELCTWIEGVSTESPNRLDAYVHANNKLIKKREIIIV
jgi:PBSX family phage terminase large subunit